MDNKTNEEVNDSLMMSSIFANANEGIILTNRKGEIVLLNPCAEIMFGYKKEELIGKRIEVLLPGDVREKHTGHRENFHEHPVNRSMGIGRDLFAKRKDGTVFPVEISLSHYKIQEEAFVIAFIIDITIRKKQEEALNKQREELEKISTKIKLLNADLEKKVEDRTMMLRETLAQLENSKNELSDSLEKEKELGDLKSRFVSTVSHEFRTPLSSILSSASLLGKYTTTEEQNKRERHVLRIKESVIQMSDMLEDLLSLGKLEEGLIVAKLDIFNASTLLEEFRNEMQEIAHKEQKIVMHFAGNEEAYSDKRLLKNILTNLVSNAIKFSPDDGVIEVTAENKDGYLQISVKDTGIGISAEDQEHLFERFFRARNAANIQGTGLGLHIVNKYLELLNGKIEIRSKINEGTEFTVQIPSANE